MEEVASYQKEEAASPSVGEEDFPVVEVAYPSEEVVNYLEVEEAYPSVVEEDYPLEEAALPSVA